MPTQSYNAQQKRKTCWELFPCRCKSHGGKQNQWRCDILVSFASNVKLMWLAVSRGARYAAVVVVHVTIYDSRGVMMMLSLLWLSPRWRWEVLKLHRSSPRLDPKLLRVFFPSSLWRSWNMFSLDLSFYVWTREYSWRPCSSHSILISRRPQ